MDCEENPDGGFWDSRLQRADNTRHAHTEDTTYHSQICDAIWLPVDTRAPAPSNFFDAFFDAFRAASPDVSIGAVPFSSNAPAAACDGSFPFRFIAQHMTSHATTAHAKMPPTGTPTTTASMAP